jgi:dethiobiotin synthetase
MLVEMGRVYFISGIDTGIGKTVVVGTMCRALQESGRDWISVKMVQTGCDGSSEDLDAHRALAGVGRFPEDEEGLTAPQIFKFPASPLLAAALEGRTVDLKRIAASVEACAKRHEIVIVEGAGGLLVPLTEETLTADFVAEQGWPLILVASGRLGAINHILLSMEAAKARGIPFAGIVMNDYPQADPLLFEDARKAVARALKRMGIACPVISHTSKNNAEWENMNISFFG